MFKSWSGGTPLDTSYEVHPTSKNMEADMGTVSDQSRSLRFINPCQPGYLVLKDVLQGFSLGELQELHPSIFIVD